MSTGASRNVLQLNEAVDKTDAVMNAFDETAKAAGFDLWPDDADGIERALTVFFTEREHRAVASAAIRASEAGW